MDVAKTKKKKTTTKKKAVSVREKLRKKAMAQMVKEADEQALLLYLSSLTKYNDKKVATFLKALEKSGFKDEVYKMTFAQLIEAMAGFAPTKKKGKSATKKGGKRGRLTAKAKKQLMDKIATAVKKSKEPLSKSDIAEAIGEDPKRCTLILRQLVADKAIKSTGAKKGTRYLSK